MEHNAFTEDILSFLAGPAGARALALAKTLDPGRPSDVMKLRKVCSVEQARAVLELVELRHRAREKFSRAERMVFDRRGYEQSSGEVLAEYKAERVRLLRLDEPIWDLCCGIGGDTIALAGAGKVTAIDSSPVRLRMADWNLRVYDRRANAELVCTAVADVDLPTGIFHLDPDQRAGRRRRSVLLDDLVPNRDDIDRLLKRTPDGVIKFSPASDYDALPWAGEIELISYRGQCRQLLLWTGKFADVKLKATSLPSGCAVTDAMPVAFDVGPIQQYLYDPDPAVSRLRLLGQLAAELGLNFLGPGQIVLTADRPVEHPLVRTFRVEEVLAYHGDRIKKYFRDQAVGTVTVKPRGTPVDVDRLSRIFSGRTGPAKVLFILRLDKKVLAVIGTETS